MTANKHKNGKKPTAGVEKRSSQWAIQGMHLPDIKYEEDLVVDLAATANDHSAHQAHHKTSSYTEVTTSPPHHPVSAWEQLQGSNPTGTATSLDQNHGSIFDDMIDISEVKSRRFHKKHDRDNEDSLPAWPSLFDTPVTYPTPLEAWQNAPHRHESLAYRLEQPAKRRRQ